jgi:peptidyl-prolyl cis-trans isomerase B (cyclophilin B)
MLHRPTEKLRFLRAALRIPLPALLLALGVAAPGHARVKAAVSREDVAEIETKYGRMVMRFFPDEAPGHVSYVKELIGKGFYNGTTFHRVIPYFVIQGGDPNSKDADRSNDGEGEADRRLKAEFSNTLHYRPGTVGMARDNDPNSGSCQFFIALENIPRLDGKYTIFGELVEGLEVARRIAELPRDLKDNPLEKVTMKVSLKTGKAPSFVNSLRQEEGREVLSGPGKPRAWDPGSSRWTSPALVHPAGKSLGTESWSAAPLDLAVSEDGAVLDVRFGSLEVPDAAKIRAAAMGWHFTPARFDGKAVKVRFSMDSHGGGLGPSKAPGTPRQIEDGIQPPALTVVVPLPPGAKPPAKQALVRLVVDESGQVSDASMEISSGTSSLDEAAMAAARKLVFNPALESKQPVSVYMNLPVRFAEAATP